MLSAAIPTSPSESTGSLPVTINGKVLYWILDTGANVSMISQSEARMLGLRVERVRSKASDLNGGATKIGATVAPKLAANV